jgi:uncharacterized repeat protein (TIGR03803 family)
VIIQASDGNFYGTTESGGINLGLCASSGDFAPGCGTVFKITPSGKLMTYRFCSVPNTNHPRIGMLFQFFRAGGFCQARRIAFLADSRTGEMPEPSISD